MSFYCHVHFFKLLPLCIIPVCMWTFNSYNSLPVSPPFSISFIVFPSVAPIGCLLFQSLWTECHLDAFWRKYAHVCKGKGKGNAYQRRDVYTPCNFFSFPLSGLSIKITMILSIESLICKCEIRQTLKLTYFIHFLPLYILSFVLMPPVSSCEI